ncbi:endonuclease/exonuclease/phosphatase family protein [Lunatibacter salilacus]|uniref:endonuclease/exonuclease/phosphatase family protein n=1 Tax=Lunatibacter salilacus TaxID=2483804 RepID=UPI00131E1963|nr:endonuclease/exonuclease/phosphatase family protein [Lunatibacter salilacus]
MVVIVVLQWLLGSLSLIASLASLIRWDDWWVRVFDFPRIQILVIHLLALVCSFLADGINGIFESVFVAGLILSFVYQFYNIYPYTVFSPKEVKKYKGKADGQDISLLVSNVYTPNRGSEKLIRLVRQYQPDILLTLESDRWWEKQLKPLEEDYPYTVKVPLDNLYGMHLYSKLELLDPQVLYLVEDYIPSIHGQVSLKSGQKVQIHCLHPEPPSPSESDTSTSRDAELLIVGKNTKDESLPILVFGDLNDVAWSRTTRLFRKISGLLDPRIGRGWYNTFHAKYPFFRWPLDHIFVSEHFKLRNLKVLPTIGSDHFPVFSHFHLLSSPSPENEPVNEEPDQEEREWAEEKIEKANPNIVSI